MNINEKISEVESKCKKLFNKNNLKESAKKRKKPYSSLTYTTGDPAFNIKEFNKRMGTDFNNPSTQPPIDGPKINREAKAAAEKIGTISAASPDGGNTITSAETSGSSASTGAAEGSACSESLTEAKRYVRRYYIRPQNIFCSNKTDILKALIDMEDENCSVYTLNNLGDDKDITKLTPRDIIYYYDGGVLYDKNHVKVMDYDLYIKHEETRKKFSSDVEKVPEATFDQTYSDRLTTADLSDKDVNIKHAIKHAKKIQEEINPFDLSFTNINAYGEILHENKIEDNICCICGEPLNGYGNNAEPYKKGKCCDTCNSKFVIPARIAQLDKKNN